MALEAARPELTLTINALLDRDLNAAERVDTLHGMKAAYVEAAVDNFAAWVHETDRAIRPVCGTADMRSTPGPGRCASTSTASMAPTATQLHAVQAWGMRTASLQSSGMAERLHAALGLRDLGRVLEYVR